MNVSLTLELEAAVKARVDSGRYASASEVVRDALRALGLRDDSEAEFHSIRESYDRGMAAYRAGRYIEVDDISSFVNQSYEEARSRFEAKQVVPTDNGR